MSPASMDKKNTLRERAAMLARTRQFFAERAIIEVDCPLATRGASVDAHIDLFPITHAEETYYLHSSPEYGMKRLLAEGIGDCFQLSHVFRQGEYGPKHNPEFTLIEWYRCGMAFVPFIEETCALIQLFLGALPHYFISYRQLFLDAFNLDPHSCDTQTLLSICKKKNLIPHDHSKDALLNILLGSFIEPTLGSDTLTIVHGYPASQAALAQLEEEAGHAVARRFEIYYQGIELANGYDELANSHEQRQRLTLANETRMALGKELLPLDESFLAALDKLPPCCGVAVGFDRLLMLRLKASSLEEILPFSWNNA